MVNREEVARLAGVSPMTVTRVVTGKGYVSERTREKVMEVIDALGYIPNKIAAGLVSGKSNRIAIVVPDLSNPYYLQVVGAMIDEAKNYDYVVSVYKASEAELPQVIESLISNRVAGVVNYASEFPKKYEKHLNDIGAKTIRTSYFSGEFSMELEYEDAMRKAIDSLIEKGAKKIIFIAGMMTEFVSIDQRVPFYKKYLKEKGLEVGEDSVVYGNYPREEAFMVGYNAAMQLVKSGCEFDAAFCMNDMMAFGVINGLRRMGKRVPEDVKVIGFDNIQMSAFFEPPLSSIYVDTRQEARFYFDYIVGNPVDYERKLVASYVERKSAD